MPTFKSIKDKDKNTVLKRLKKRSPSIPDFTCTDIDYIIEKIESYHSKGLLTVYASKLLKRKLERLRSSNEALRDGGRYWYKKFKSLFLKNRV